MTDKEVMNMALDALTESVDLVTNEYVEAVELYSGYPSRQHRLTALKTALDAHNAAIDSLGSAIAQPAEKCFCDANNLGAPSVSCGDCPTRDYNIAQPEQPTAYPLETQAEFALKTLVIKGWVTQEKVDRVLQIAAKFTAHIPKETP